ncbi:MAG: tetratricopeptide repeat protein [Methylococcaceae bacterium]
MSLINQMLRDLESRSTTNNEASVFHRNIQATPLPASKMRSLIWGLLSIVAAGGTYWAFQYSKALAKTPAVIVADSIKKAPVPVVPYEKVLAAPNAIANPAPKIEQKSADNIMPRAVLPAPAVQAAAAVQPKAPAKPVQTVPTAPAEIADEAPVKKIPVVPKPAQIKPTTAKQQADVLYRQAENNSEAYSAIDTLEQVLMLDPRHLKARLLLAKTLHNQGQVNKTAEFLDQSLALFPDNLQFINTRAQLYLQQRNPGGALKTLQRIGLTDSSNETYLSLLAATYQQQQSFGNAAKVYQRLVTVNPEKAENWLGLALAQEKLGNSQFAREAYQQALSKSTLKESIAGYIKQRLIELR